MYVCTTRECPPSPICILRVDVCVVVSCGSPYSWVERWPKDLVDSLDVILAGEVLTRKKIGFKLISAHVYYALQKNHLSVPIYIEG